MPFATTSKSDVVGSFFIVQLLANTAWAFANTRSTLQTRLGICRAQAARSLDNIHLSAHHYDVRFSFPVSIYTSHEKVRIDYRRR